MRWDPNHESGDVEDRRGQGGGRGGIGAGGLFGLFFLLARSPLGIVGALVVVGGVLAFNYVTRGAAPSQNVTGQGVTPRGPGEDKEAKFVGFVLDDVQDTWTQIFKAQGKPYRRAKLVLYTDRTSTGCGEGEATTGPFYCPVDSNAYLDLGFFRELQDRLGARGEFAQAYVLAHEIGHHVQSLSGTSERVHRAPRSEQTGANGLSVRLELQADCYAGVWARSTGQRKLLEAGDLESAMSAAAAVGDDRLQRQARGTVRPESFTHGTSAQRLRWFNKGERDGVSACDTFGTSAL